MKKLTSKQAKFVEGVAKGKPGTQAALEAYDTTDYQTAAAISSENLNKPQIRSALEPILAKHDISLDSAIAPIGKGLRAVKFNEFTGEVTEDLKLQMQASDRALKLMGVQQEPVTQIFQVINEQKNNYGI